ncbi:MAG: OsmC family protein [Proteobacteria bacterium]|nr:OsmC family protein [Pseudomonadota bacterium]
MTIQARLRRNAVPAEPLNAITLLTNGHHAWTADVESEAGGLEQSPSPHDLLDSALAACTTLTLELYIRRKGWPVTDLEVSIDHVETRGTDGRVHYAIERRIRIVGDIADADRQRLLDIAGKCPIHRLLEGDTTITSKLV